MKKLNYLLLLLLFLSSFSLNTTAQDKNALGKKLFSLVVDGNTAAALELIKQGANVNYQTGEDSTLSKAVSGGNVNLIKALLEAGANPNQMLDAPAKITVLHKAIRAGSVEIVELFIKYKADVNHRTTNGNNSLHVAALWNPEGKITELLLAAGADPSVLNSDSRTPRDVAVNNRHPAVADVLAKVMKPEAGTEGRDLFEAVKMKDKARALDLIKQTKNLNYEAEGDSTLSLAILNKDNETAKALLEAGANPNLAESKYGNTPLGRAVQMSDVNMVELLIGKYKADVKRQSKTGFTILHTAAIFNSDEKITALLIAAGANPNAVNDKKESALTIALYENKKKIADLLDKVSTPETKALALEIAAPKIKQTVAENSRNEAQNQKRQEAADFAEKQKQAIRAYGAAHQDLEFALARYENAVKKYNAAGEAQYLYKGTLANAYRSLATARGIITNFLKEHGKYLPRDLYDHLLEDYGKIPSSPYR